MARSVFPMLFTSLMSRKLVHTTSRFMFSLHVLRCSTAIARPSDPITKTSVHRRINWPTVHLINLFPLCQPSLPCTTAAPSAGCCCSILFVSLWPAWMCTLRLIVVRLVELFFYLPFPFWILSPRHAVVVAPVCWAILLRSAQLELFFLLQEYYKLGWVACETMVSGYSRFTKCLINAFRYD